MAVNRDWFYGFPTGTLATAGSGVVGNYVQYRFEVETSRPAVTMKYSWIYVNTGRDKRAEGRAHRRRMIRRQGGKH